MSLKQHPATGRGRNHGLVRLSAGDHSGEMDSPSQCEHCGSDRVVYDRTAGEIICQKCGTAVRLGAQKSDAIRLVSRSDTEFTPRKLLLVWYRKKSKIAADQVDLLCLEHQITKMTTRPCARCRKKPAAIRDGPRGRHPEYCTDCRKQVDAQMVKASMKKKPEKYKDIKRRSRKPSPRPKEHALGGKPLSARDMHGLGLSLIPSDLPITDDE